MIEKSRIDLALKELNNLFDHVEILYGSIVDIEDLDRICIHLQNIQSELEQIKIDGR